MTARPAIKGMMNSRAGACVIALLAALTACSPSADDGNTTATNAIDSPVEAAGNGAAPLDTAPADTASNDLGTGTAVSEPREAATNDGETVGGDGSPIRLLPLTSADIRAADLEGELACAFEQKRDAVLLIANGNAGRGSPVFGIWKAQGGVERVGNGGGFDGMVDGATFTGPGTTIHIRITDRTASKGTESPARAAQLVFNRADGASRTFPGWWRCGP